MKFKLNEGTHSVIVVTKNGGGKVVAEEHKTFHKGDVITTDDDLTKLNAPNCAPRFEKVS